MMNPHILIQGPARVPNWRLRHVMQMSRHRPEPLRPGRHDDKYIRGYRLMLLAFAAAGGDVAKQTAVFREYPHVWQAHRLHYSPDIEHRQILEARLLTSETLEEIAGRYHTTPEAIDYFEKLFFHVRDRLDNPLWISVMIKGGPSSGRENKNGVMTDQERAYVYRWFAYFGGPLALDAAVNGMVSTIPKHAEDVRNWFDTTLNETVRIGAAAAAVTLRLNQKNMMQLIKLASRKSAAKTATSAKDSSPELEEWAGTVLAEIGEGRALLERAKSQAMKSTAEPCPTHDSP